MPAAFDIVVLAKRINQRRHEYNRLHPGQLMRITPGMSRILENDPDYHPYRRGHAANRQKPVDNPTIRTLVEIAEALGTTVGDLLGEPWPVSPDERATLARLVRVIQELITTPDKTE